MSNITNDGLTQ